MSIRLSLDACNTGCAGCPAAKTCAAFSRYPAFHVIGEIKGRHHDISLPRTDFVVVTKAEGAELGIPLERLDASHFDGVVERKLSESGFQGTLGEHLLIDLRAEGAQHTPVKYVLVVGIGTAEKFTRRAMCGFFRLALEQAVATKSSSMTFLVLPLRMTNVNLRGSFATLKCRVVLLSHELGDLDPLTDINIVCAPQAMAQIEQGLEIATPLCPTCHDPRIA